MIFQERNRAVAAARFNAMTIRHSKLDAGQRMAKTLGGPLYVGLQVRVGGRWDSGWLLPWKLFKQYAREGAAGLDFNLSKTAREAYAAETAAIAGSAKFEVK